jgi:hypothetical protein
MAEVKNPVKVEIFKGNFIDVKEQFNEFSRYCDGTIHKFSTCGTPDNMALTVMYSDKLPYRYS